MQNSQKQFLLVNKPVGWTSYDVIGYLKQGLRKAATAYYHSHENDATNDMGTGGMRSKIKKIKIGHTGTLDPFATGLLIVGVGREATRELDSFKQFQKTYRADITLGATSTTQDCTGTISPAPEVKPPNEEEVRQTITTFLGEQAQIPPMFSAKKVQGKRLYKLARAGVEVKREPSIITIYSINVISYSWPKLTIDVSCSAGTYVRTLAADIGSKLGTGAYCEALERTSIGEYNLKDARTVEELSVEFLQSLLPKIS